MRINHKEIREKIWVPDGIQTHDPLHSSRKLQPLETMVSKSYLEGYDTWNASGSHAVMSCSYR